MAQHLGLVSIVVRDYDAALAFYVGVLGFERVEDRPMPEQHKRWDQTGGRVFLFLHTDDFWRDHARYAAQGVAFVRGPTHEPYGTVAVFRDLYGNLWDLIGPPSGAAAAPHAPSPA